MIYQDLQRKKLPNQPGVYMFVERGGKMLYIGKASSLKDRVRSYFNKGVTEARGPHIHSMVEMAKTVRFIETDSVLEALILEAQLIKKHKPRYNTKEKDDKSFNYVVITKEDFPRVLLMRAKEFFNPRHKPKYDIKYSFGPYPQGGTLKEALRIVRKIFPFRDRCTPVEANLPVRRRTQTGKPCFNRQIGLCPGVCTGEISKKEYAKTIRHLKLFFEGKKKTVLRKLKKEMAGAASKLEFERAGKIKRTIFALGHIQDIALIGDEQGPVSDVLAVRIEAYDVAHISGKFAVGVMAVVQGESPQKSEYRKFKIKSFEGVNDTRALKEILERRLAHARWELPRLVVVDGGAAQKNAAEKVLREAGIMIPVVAVVKNERHKPKGIRGGKELMRKHEKEILLANSEAHRFAIAYHKKLRSEAMKG
ncbi:MAG: excinuclease ABC subunit UvrC [Patescibacteria group bacterium]|nr:MAG: excinuclease ABC subunit UvrC [Patescibacteria group bacterium]